jgi:hypothetical protein
MERSKRYVENCHKELEDESNSKGERSRYILDFVYKWHVEYINNVDFMPMNYVVAFTRTIEYMELHDSNCIICHNYMDICPDVYANTMYLTSCLNCNMPICSNCMYAASQVSEQCPSCQQTISSIHLTYDAHVLIRQTAGDFVKVFNSHVVYADDLLDDVDGVDDEP